MLLARRDINKVGYSNKISNIKLHAHSNL